jgi:hypothetical protein
MSGAGNSLMLPLRINRILSLTVECSLPLLPSIGIDNKAAGEMAGWLGAEWNKTHWAGQSDKIAILTDYRVIMGHCERFYSVFEIVKAKFSESRKLNKA